MVAFVLTLQSWEAIAVSFQSSLLNGGPVSMLIVGLGSTALAVSAGRNGFLCMLWADVRHLPAG
jgi:hypothetical protein